MPNGIKSFAKVDEEAVSGSASPAATQERLIEHKHLVNRRAV